MGVKVIRIYELDGIVNARLELAGSFFEVEVPAGPVAGGYLNKRLSFEQFAALLGGGYVARSLPSAQGLVAGSDVAPNTLYGITGDWNATGTDTTVFLHGVRPDAYHKLGIIYNAQGAGQLVEVNVAVGTYKKQGADKADLDPATGRLTDTQAPQANYPLYVDGGQYYFDDLALGFAVQAVGKRVNPATGALENAADYTTLIASVDAGTAYSNLQLPLFYAAYYIVSNQFVKPWAVDANGVPTGSKNSISHKPANNAVVPISLRVSVKTSDLDRVHVTPSTAYDDAAVRARLDALDVLGGRLRGPWAAATAYKQYDMVVQGGGLCYANATFTSGSSFDASKWTVISLGGASPGVATPAGTALVFTQDAEYATVYNGTFTVDATNAKAGVVVVVRLGASATAPTIPAGFVLLGDNTISGDKRRYSFCVAPDGSIEYYITRLP